tara:strand:- start:1417 stop:1755 length:339 start_codon:yes stop_codon:yes gene_type:complete
MSVDHGVYSSPESERPVFLGVVPGMTVIVKHDFLTGEKRDKDWWMGLVIHCGGAARDPKIHNLFQIPDVDSGVIRWVNADLVTHILPKAQGNKKPALGGDDENQSTKKLSAT